MAIQTQHNLTEHYSAQQYNTDSVK